MKANLLRVVRSALARTTPPGVSTHPDANLLGAFAENTLLAREREEIAGHLAKCADCREFLALAFAAEVDEPAVAVKPRVVRRWSPVWSWAASVATVCIVVSAVWEFRAQWVPPIEAPPAPAAIETPQTSLASPSPGPRQAAAGKAASAKPAATPPNVGPAAASVPSPAPEAASAPVAAMAPKSAPAPPPPQAAPPPQPLLAKQETADVVSAGAQLPAGEKDKIAQSNPPATVQSPPQGFAQEEKTSRGAMKSSGAGAVSSNRFGAMARAASARRDMPAGPGFLWTIASSQQRGIVQRSRDGGATWETVPLNDQISFRAVVSTGSDVWAGGSAGALFHSTDAGIHWERVPIDATGSILEIRTRNGAEVAVTTDAHERWLSEDNGRTWQLTDTPR